MSIKLELQNVTYYYGKGTAFEVKALDNVSFAIKEKSITGLIGHTGSGKSTHSPCKTQFVKILIMIAFKYQRQITNKVINKQKTS